MSTNEAKRLLKMTAVMWDNNPDDLGMVLEIGSNGFFVDWENGQRGWIDYRDAKRVSLFQPRLNNKQ